MQVSRLLAFALSVALAMPVAAQQDEPSPDEILASVADEPTPAFSYDLYCDVHGLLSEEHYGAYAALYLVQRPSHLEQVYSDSRRGMRRAQRLWKELEEVFAAAGREVADQSTGLLCLVLPPECQLNWAFLDRLLVSNGPGATHLHRVLTGVFAGRARQRGMEQRLILATVDLIVARAALRATSRPAAAMPERPGAAAGTEPPSQRPGVRGHVPSSDLVATEALALERRLWEAEAVTEGSRFSASLERLQTLRPSRHKPPHGTANSEPLWIEYVTYFERRLEELAGRLPRLPGLSPPLAPLTWEAYKSFRTTFQRGVEFQRSVTQTMEQEATRPATERSLLRGQREPLVADSVGLAHEGSTSLTYADQLVVDTTSLKSGAKPRIETFSNKSRDFKNIGERETVTQARADMLEAKSKYGGAVEVRRVGHPLFGLKSTVSKVHLVYDASLLPEKSIKAIKQEAWALGVEVHFYAQ